MRVWIVDETDHFASLEHPSVFFNFSAQLGHILEKEGEISLGRQKCSVWWHDTSYCTDDVLHTTYVRESRFICKCHIFKFSFVRTFRWNLWFSSSQPLNLPSEDKKNGWCYYLTLCSAPYKWQLSACIDREDIYRFISRWQQPRTVFRDKLILFL